MKTRTTTEPTQSKIKINHHNPIICLGSCFADRIGNRLKQLKFKGLYNPFGVLYNPYSLANLMIDSIEQTPADPSLFCNLNDRFVHFGYHSDMNASTREELSSSISHQQKNLRELISSANVVIITLGTAHVYRHKKTNKFISNCHKQPGNLFDRILISEVECYQSISRIEGALKAANPIIKIIWTVSPVRHLRDTLIQNNRSKAHLLSAIHRVIEASDNSEYFPSYEIMMDDLRDYRYYERDLIHPNDIAIDYIWEYFADRHMDTETQSLNVQIGQILKCVSHRPFNPDSTQHKAFLQNTLTKIDAMEEHGFDWSKEIEMLGE